MQILDTLSVSIMSNKKYYKAALYFSRPALYCGNKVLFIGPCWCELVYEEPLSLDEKQPNNKMLLSMFTEYPLTQPVIRNNSFDVLNSYEIVL